MTTSPDNQFDLAHALRSCSAEAAGATEGDQVPTPEVFKPEQQCHGGPNDRDKLGGCGKPATHVARRKGGAARRAKGEAGRE